MLILLTIFLFIFTAFAMVILHLVRPRLSIQGFLGVMAVLFGLVMVFLSHSDIPDTIVLLQWAPQSLFPIQPALLLDDISWYFALALTALAFTVVITSIAQLGQNPKSDQQATRNNIQVVEASSGPNNTGSLKVLGAINESGMFPDWLFWAAILVLTGAGLMAVTAGNILTLLLAWAALDILELIILLGQIPQSAARERVIIVFSARLAGTVSVLIAGLLLWSQGGVLQFNALSQSINVILILAASIRLGVFPPQHLYRRGLPIRTDLATILRLVSAAASFILLVRVSTTGVSPSFTPLLLGFIALVGIFAALRWLGAKDELDGRSYWILGTASPAIAAAIVGSPFSCLVWSIASLLSGGLIFSFSLRHLRFIPLILLGVFNLSSLPFSPTWQGAALYQSILTVARNRALYLIFSISFFLSQSILLSGYIRHFLKGVQPTTEDKSQHIERWVWVLYPFGLVIIVLVHLLLGWFLLPDLQGLPLVTWLIGPLTLLVAALILFASWRFPQPFPSLNRFTKTSFSNNLFSLEWLYNFIWQAYHTITRVIAVFSTILEGDGGILWALVLFALIFVFLQR
jgi:formate hydrogenlyase subunit 3/multisubunit Na+/H+ antiporter MnhD subunit